jgi:protoheme IX farnesyltransferase
MLRVKGLLCSGLPTRVVLRSGSYAGTGVRYLSDTTTAPVKPSKKIDPHSFRGKVKSYLELSKFRLSSMVVLTSGAGYVCAGLPFDYTTMAAVCTGTALCAASAGTFNQIFEIDEDSRMKRTLQRPLPAGNVTPTAAAAFGTCAGVAGTALLYAATNPVVAALGLANIGLYAGVYTYTKKHTELNTWIGSLVGAIPPVMGWAAATGGSVIAAEPAALAGLLFLWQFPHFFALSYLHREDYARGGFQMVAVNDPTGERSARLILEYSLYLTALPIAASVGGLTSYMFAFEGTAANAYLLYLAGKFYRDRTNAGAKRVFLCSLWYLPVLLAGFVFHNRMWDKATVTETETTDEVGSGVMKRVCLGYCSASSELAV